MRTILYTISAHVPERHKDGVRCQKHIVVDGQTVIAIHPTNAWAFHQSAQKAADESGEPVFTFMILDAVYCPDGTMIPSISDICWN